VPAVRAAEGVGVERLRRCSMTPGSSAWIQALLTALARARWHPVSLGDSPTLRHLARGASSCRGGSPPKSRASAVVGCSRRLRPSWSPTRSPTRGAGASIGLETPLELPFPSPPRPEPRRRSRTTWRSAIAPSSRSGLGRQLRRAAARGLLAMRGAARSSASDASRPPGRAPAGVHGAPGSRRRESASRTDAHRERVRAARRSGSTSRRQRRALRPASPRTGQGQS
jgi:hypothetical protein